MAGKIIPSGVKPHGELTGLLLGAGASYDLGMPLVWELTGELKAWLTPEKLRNLNQHWHTKGGAGFGFPDTAIENLASVLERSDMHYENILGHLQVEILRDHNLLQSYNGLYLFISEIIYALLKERHLRNIGYIERNIGYLNGITTLTRKNAPLWIFSLNHDLIIESFSTHVGIPLKSGFTDEIVRLPRRNREGTLVGELEAYVLPAEVLERQALPFFNRGEEGINLLKIHGSLDIFTFRDGSDVLKLRPSGAGIQGVLASLCSANQELRYVDRWWPDGTVKAANEIIYADQSGEMQFLRRSILAGAYKFDSRHSQVIPNELLGHFRTYINFLTTLVCIGYSFGDQHINQVVREWLEFTSERRLIIVDPDAKRIPDGFLHMAQQVEIVTHDCTAYLDKVGSIGRTSLERAERRFGTWMRKNGPEASSIFSDFLKQEKNHQIEKFIEFVKTLPMRDGDIDLGQLGITGEELSKMAIAEVSIPSPEEILDKFLRQEAANDQ